MSAPRYTPSETEPERRNWVWFSFQVVLRLLFCLWLRYRARGHEALPEQGGMLLVINHQSFLDPLLVGLPLRRPVSYVARDNLFRVPIIGWILRNTYVFPINRESATAGAIREMVARLKIGFWCGVFPEGTRSRDGRIGEFKPGFLAILKRADVPVCPVGIAGAGRALRPDSFWPRLAKVRVVFGSPIPRAQVAAAIQADEESFLKLIHGRLQECHNAAESWCENR